MKQEWSSSWARSVQPRKQRKYRLNAPLHVKRKFMSSHLSKELIKQYGKRSLFVRKGDQVEVMRGSSKGMRGAVDHTNLRKHKVYVEGIIFKKTDGSEVMRALEPSNLKITKLNLDDSRRKTGLLRSGNKKKPQANETKKQQASPEKADSGKK